MYKNRVLFADIGGNTIGNRWIVHISKFLSRITVQDTMKNHLKPYFVLVKKLQELAPVLAWFYESSKVIQLHNYI